MCYISSKSHDACLAGTVLRVEKPLGCRVHKRKTCGRAVEQT